MESKRLFTWVLLAIVLASATPAAAQLERSRTPIRKAKPDVSRAISGLWTHLLIQGGPVEPRRLKIIYQDDTMAWPHLFKPACTPGVPMVLDIEHNPLNRDEWWWMDRTRNTEEVMARSEAYMLSRLEIAAEQNAIVSMWSRPTQNALIHIWKPNQQGLLYLYESRWRDCQAILRLQDFISVQLYMPSDHEPYIKEAWPLEQWKARGDWFIRHGRKNGKPVMIFLSTNWNGASKQYIPATWLEEATEHFLAQGVGVCIWGGYENKWSEQAAMCKTLRKLMARHNKS